MADEKQKDFSICPHCGVRMKRWRCPEMTTWETEWMYVCFNDDCSYFKRGWDWMLEKYDHRASYRHRCDPTTGESGPLPVWSPNAMRDKIIEDDEETPGEKAESR